jgi:hypothetical protein
MTSRGSIGWSDCNSRSSAARALGLAPDGVEVESIILRFGLAARTGARR